MHYRHSKVQTKLLPLYIAGLSFCIHRFKDFVGSRVIEVWSTFSLVYFVKLAIWLNRMKKRVSRLLLWLISGPVFMSACTAWHMYPGLQIIAQHAKFKYKWTTHPIGWKCSPKNRVKHLRASRTVEALTSFVSQQLASCIREFTTKEQLEQMMDKSKRNIIAYYANRDSEEYSNFNVCFILTSSSNWS